MKEEERRRLVLGGRCTVLGVFTATFGVLISILSLSSSSFSFSFTFSFGFSFISSFFPTYMYTRSFTYVWAIVHEYTSPLKRCFLSGVQTKTQRCSVVSCERVPSLALKFFFGTKRARPRRYFHRISLLSPAPNVASINLFWPYTYP